MTSVTHKAVRSRPKAVHAYGFLTGGGEMGGLIQAFDWSKTTMGALETWPQSLRTAVSIMLQSPVPIVMLWGKDGIMLYNDAYSIFAGGRHPMLLGSKVVEGWPEVAAFNANVLANVLHGKTLSYQNQQLTLLRSGAPEEVWMDLNYSPILDESGSPAGVLSIVVETTQRILAEGKQKIAEDELSNERERLHSLFMQAPAVIAVLRGADHVFELANPLYMEITGNRPILGKPIRQALPELEGQGIFNILDEVYLSAKPYFGNEIPLAFDRNGDGKTDDVYFNFVYQPSFDSAGDVDGILVHAVDVTIQVKLREEEKRALEEQQRLVAMTHQRNELIKLNHAKDEFISLASHQLRTPATAVKQYTSLLLGGYGGSISTAQQKFLQIAYDSNERQLNIINDLLKTAQLDSSRYVLQTENVRIAALIQGVADELESTLELKSQEIEFMERDNPVEVLVDTGEMKLVFANLLENASKYSHFGKTITIELTSDDDGVYIDVIDRGVGLSGDNLDRIFEKFTRIDNELSDTVTGSGLGLYWVKRIVKLHHGSINVTSELGGGTTFSVRLPH